MSYSIALVQNDSELLRYSHADMSYVLKSFGYEITQFTAENIQELTYRKKEFNALIIATNALSDYVLQGYFLDNEEVIEFFVESSNTNCINFVI